MADDPHSRGRPSLVVPCVALGSALLAGVGAIWPVPPDLTAISGAVYGFLLGALVGVVLDKRRDRE
jgi:hypothetical protein